MLIWEIPGLILVWGDLCAYRFAISRHRVANWATSALLAALAALPLLAFGSVHAIAAQTVEHLAAQALNGDLIVFYWEPGADWKAVNVTSKTGQKVASAATSWQTRNGDLIVEHLAAQAPNGDLIVFYWEPGADWKAVNVSSKTGQKVASAATSWQTRNGDLIVEHLAAQAPNGDLIVFYWEPGADWKAVNVTSKTGQKVASAATSWQTRNGDLIVEHLAAQAPNGDLIVFYWEPGADWKAVNVTSKTGQKVASAATSWQVPNGNQIVEHLAAQAPNGDLIVFYWEPGADWKAVNVTSKTGQKVASAATSWQTRNGDLIVEHLAAQAPNGDLIVFYWEPGADWKAVNVTSKTGQKVASAATSWQVPNGGLIVEHLAAQAPNGDLIVFYWEPGADWKAVNVSSKTGQKVASAATSWQVAAAPESFRKLATYKGVGGAADFMVGPGPTPGSQRLYVDYTYANNTLDVVAIDPDTGKFQVYGNPTKTEWAPKTMTVGPDGNIYIPTVPQGRILRLNPTDGTFVDVGRPSITESYIWQLVVGSDHRIYGCTYPSAKLVRYDPATGALEDLGRMDPVENYTRFVAASGDGFIYTGIGYAKSHLAAYEISTGAHSDILPAKYQVTGVTSVWKGDDGNIYASVPGQYFRLQGGNVVLIAQNQARPEAPAPASPMAA